MKKNKIIKFVIILTLFLIILMQNSISLAAQVTLEKIVEKFNKSSIVDFNKNEGVNIVATNNSNAIKIVIDGDKETETIEFLFKDNILFIEIDSEEENALSKAYIALEIIDIIGQLHGYKENELILSINDIEGTKDYTLEKEGYERKQISENKFEMKVDITKKIPLLDFSNTYFKVSDLQKYKTYIQGNGSTEMTRGNVWFNCSGYDGEKELLIAEKGKLTENTYKSLLSIIEVMFEDEKVIQYFKNNYSSIESGDKTFKGFSIKANPKDKTDWEETLIPSDSGYEFMRINIDKPVAIAVANGKEEIIDDDVVIEDNTNNYEDDEIIIDEADNKWVHNTAIMANKLLRENEGKTGSSSTKYPNAGLENNIFVPIIKVLIGMLVISLAVMIIKVRKRNED